MYLITTKNCAKCKMLRQMLGDKYFFVEIRDAEDVIGTCRIMGIKSVPALVVDENTFTTDLDAIVDMIDKNLGESK